MRYIQSSVSTNLILTVFSLWLCSRWLQLGVPFSDPIADGPTIQRASFVALQNDINIQDVFDFIKVARDQGLTIPVILMG
jgi:tryptophan synthase alpha subunit